VEGLKSRGDMAGARAASNSAKTWCWVAFGLGLGVIVIYVAAMVVVGLHVRHGFWSAFQSLGANHPKLMPAISALSVAAGLIVGFGFGLLPIFISLRF